MGQADLSKGGLWARWTAQPLWRRILLFLVLGVIAGIVLGERAAVLKPVGDVFIRLIRMIVVPLVLLSVTAGILTVADPKRLGRIGLKFIALALLTSGLAVTIGIGLGLIFKPGVGVSLGVSEAPSVLAETPSLGQQLIAAVPINPFEALAKGDVLQILFFGIVFALGVMASGEGVRSRVKPVLDDGLQIMLRVTGFVMEVAPFGVGALICWVIGTSGFGPLRDVAVVALLLHAGCLLQLAVAHILAVKLYTRLPLGPLLRGMTDVGLVAYSTTSSAATLPVALRVAEKNLGVAPGVAGTILPLGVTFTKDGSAMYAALLAVFAAQVFGVPLGAGEIVLIGLASALVAIATAPVPSATLFVLAVVLDVLGLNAGQIALVVAFFLPFDRPLDMIRTAINNTVDVAGVVMIAKSEGQLDEAAYRARS